MKSKIEQYKAELAELMETKNDPDTPKDIKDAIEPAIKKLNLLITGLGVKNLQSKVSKAPATSKKESKAPSTAKKSSDASLERCKEILAKYNDKKKSDAKRVEKRKKAGKPAELTPSETIKKAAKSVKTKVVEMDKGLKVSEEASIIRGILDSVVSAMSGIKDSHRKKMFIGKIIEGLRKLEKGVRMKTAEDGMYLHEINGDLEDDNAEMLRLNIVEIRHHADEIMQSLNGGSEVEAWVLSRSDRAKTDMSDIAHYLDSSLKVDSMADGGMMADSGFLSKLPTEYNSFNYVMSENFPLNNGNMTYIIYGMSNDSSITRKIYLYMNESEDFEGMSVGQSSRDNLEKQIKLNNAKIYFETNYADENEYDFMMADGGMMAKGGVSKDEKKYEASYNVQGLNSSMKFGAKSDREAIKLATTKLKRPNAELLNIYLVEGDKYTIIYGDSWESIRDTPKMAKGGEIEEGDYVFVKPEKLNGEVVRITGENVVVEFNDRRPKGGDKRGNYKIKDLKKMSDGGMMAKGGQVHYDLFVVQDKIPQKVQDVLDDYVEYGEDITYEQLMSMQRDMERVGYTFDFGLDAIPYGLRPLGVDIDELQEYEENEYSDAGYYADGGMMRQSKLLEKVSEDWGRDSDFYSELEEAIIGWSDRHGELTPKGKIAIKKILINYDSLEDYEQYLKDGGMTAGRGRLLSALNRDRAYMSSQEWEKNYKRKGSPKKPKYNTSYAVGGQAKVKQYPDLSKIKANVIN
jgi:hypothetical protein